MSNWKIVMMEHKHRKWWNGSGQRVPDTYENFTENLTVRAGDGGDSLSKRNVT